MKALLSIDFDFFVREKVIWDWGHSENNGLFYEMIWVPRYGSPAIPDLWDETDPDKHADFSPVRIKDVLRFCNVHITPDTILGIGESHKDAYHEFQRTNAEMLIHLDAHTDIATFNEIDCGSWLYHLALNREKHFKEIWILLPRWRKAFGDTAKEERGSYDLSIKKIEGYTGAKVHIEFFEGWISPEEPVLVDGLYYCRSGAWVPPHLDGLYRLSVQTLITTASIKPDNIMDYKFIQRKAPTREEAERWRKQTIEGMQALKDASKLYKDYQEANK